MTTKKDIALTHRHGLKIRAGPSGLHLFHRRTGLNVLCDEIRLPPAVWSAAPRQISVALTNACDLACPYCYAPKNRAELEMDSLVNWLHELDTNGCLTVGFGGGEPTLYRYFVELCGAVAKGTGLAITFTTHAHRIDQELASKLKGKINFVRISMDGIGPTYEKLRSRSFASLCSRFRLIRSLHDSEINFVVNATTIRDLDTAVSLSRDVGASEFLLLPEQPVRGRGGIDRVTHCALRDWINSYRGDIPLSISEAGSEGMPIVPASADGTGLRAYAHIGADGTLKRSSYDNKGIPNWGGRGDGGDALAARSGGIISGGSGNEGCVRCRW